jgi:hypothetical protein
MKHIYNKQTSIISMFYFTHWQFSVLVLFLQIKVWSFKTFHFPVLFPQLFQTATFEIQRLKYQLVEGEEVEEDGREGGGGGEAKNQTQSTKV